MKECSTLMSSRRNWNSFNLSARDVKYPWNLGKFNSPMATPGDITDVPHGTGIPSVVTCSASEVGDYLRHVEKQTYPCYNKIDPARFCCECDLSLVLATSHSVNNPEWLYLKCPAHTCKFFQWINQPPETWPRALLLTETGYIRIFFKNFNDTFFYYISLMPGALLDFISDFPFYYISSFARGVAGL